MAINIADIPGFMGSVDGEPWISTPEGNRPLTQADIAAYEAKTQTDNARTEAAYAAAGGQRVSKDRLQSGADPGMGLVSIGGDENNLWMVPQSYFHNTTNGGNGFLDALPWSEASREAYSHPDPSKSDMGPGLAVMFGGPAAGFAGTAIAGAGAAGAAGAGAAEGGAAGTGIDASTGLYAGESTGGSYLSSESLAGSAGSDTLGGGAAASDPLYVNEPSYLTDPAYWNPMGGTEGLAAPGAEGVAGSTATYGSTDFLTQAASLAKDYGITTASAIKLLQGPAGSSLITALGNAAGRAAPGVIGAVAAKKQADSLDALAKQYMDLGAPSRARYEGSFAPGFTMENDPGYKGALEQSAKATLHGLSVNGNPAGSPNAWNRSLTDLYEKTAYPALQNYRNTNANAGGIATLQTAAPAAATGAINAQGNVFNAAGAGINDIFNPQPSLAQTLAEYQRLTKAQAP